MLKTAIIALVLVVAATAQFRRALTYNYECLTTYTPPVLTQPMRMHGWGTNWYGQLGFDKNRTYEPLSTIVTTNAVTKIKKVAGGFMQTAVLEDPTGVWTAGDGSKSQLGIGPLGIGTIRQFNRIEQLVSGKDAVTIANHIIQDVSAGWYHTCVVLEKPGDSGIGHVYCAGSNAQGQLGTEAYTEISWLVPVVGLSGSFKKVVCGPDHTLAMDVDGKLWSWGNNDEGQLGRGSFQFTSSKKPVEVTGLPGLSDPVTDIKCGYRFCIALTQAGALWGWGSNTVSQLGGASTQTKVGKPVQIIASGVTMIAAGGYHVLVVKDGKLWSWGSATLGQTGHADPTPTIRQEWAITKPTAISVMSKVNIQYIDAGLKHSIVLDMCGEVYTFGSDAFGQLGVGYVGEKKDFREMLPVPVDRVKNWELKPIMVAAGAFHSFVVSKA